MRTNPFTPQKSTVWLQLVTSYFYVLYWSLLSTVVFLPILLSADNGEKVAGAAGGPAIIKNPLATNSIQEFLEAVLTVVMVLAVPVIIFFVIYSGFLYVTARGNSEQVKKATTAFTYAIVGGLIVLGAMVLVSIIQNLVSAFMAA